MSETDSDLLIDQLTGEHISREALTCECGGQRFMLCTPNVVYCQNCAGEMVHFVWSYKNPS